MVDPNNITDFNATDEKLEEYIIFWVLVAGKNATTTAKSMELLFNRLNREYYGLPQSIRTPFNLIKNFINNEGFMAFVQLMKTCGFGQFNQKARYLEDLVNSRIDLRTCTVEDLEAIKGIGPKTARCFLLHNRPGQRLAGLDTHILKYLASLGYDVPKSTPTGKKYREVEALFLKVADEKGMEPADLDLKIWLHYKQGDPRP